MNKKSSNASAIAFGFEFQKAAGIQIFLDNVEHAAEVEIEGQKEDIEIRMSDGSVLYAQAKSVVNPNDKRNAIKKLRDALASLAKCDGDIFKLVYVTNLYDPINSNAEMVYANRLTSFDNLLQQDQETIRGIVNKIPSEKKIDLSKFQIQSIKFAGTDKEERYSEIKKKVAEFLTAAGVETSETQQVLKEWLFLFGDNETKQRITLSKKEVMFHLILVLIRKEIAEDKFKRVCDLDNFDFVMEQYEGLIARMDSKFDFFTLVCSDYMERMKSSSKYCSENFVREEWKRYEEYFHAVTDNPDTLEAITKIALLSTLNKRFKIKNVKEAAGIQ